MKRKSDAEQENRADNTIQPRYEHETDEYTAMDAVITALFDTTGEAQEAVAELIDNGVRKEDISVVANDLVNGPVSHNEKSVSAQSGAVIGGLGGLVIGLVALAIPGIGPVIAAGPIATAIVGAGIGSVTGGLIGVLTDMGLDDQEAEYYAEGVRRGGTIVAVQTDDNKADQVIDIMERHNPVDLEERAEAWYESGWMGYNPEAGPYNPEVVEEQRDLHAGAHDIEINRAISRQ